MSRWMSRGRLLLRSVFERRQVEQELDEEMRFHLQCEIDRRMEAGLSADEAQLEARRAMGAMTQNTEECRSMRGLDFVEQGLQDLRYALRTLRKSPMFAAVAILSLALGIGANTAIFSVMDVLLLRPLPVRDPSGLAMVRLLGKNPPRYSFPYPTFEMIRDRNAVFTNTFAWTMKQYQTPVGDDIVHIPAVLASGDYFAGLGVDPIAGRVFTGEDDNPAGGSSGPVSVISEGLWRRQYGRNSSTIGQTLVLNGVATTIIGVMPARFFGAEVGTAPDVWVPLNLQRQLENARCISSPNCFYLKVMGRVKPGVSEAQAEAQLKTISRGILTDSNPPARADRRADFLAQVFHLTSGTAGYTGLWEQVRLPLRVLMTLVGFVLMIACANLANLLTARATARNREVAVRLAIGASRMRVARQFLTESLLLAGMGAVVGLGIAIWATKVLISLLSSTAVLDLRPDWRVLLFTALVAVATAVIFGIVPAYRATQSGLNGALNERVKHSRGGPGRPGLGRALVGVQVALSVVLLASATLLAGSLTRLLTESPGFDPRGVTVVSLDTSRLPVKSPAELLQLWGNFLERVKGMPRVESASLMSITPLGNGGWENFVTIPGRPDIPEEQRNPSINSVGPHYCRTMRIPVLAGRDISDADTPQSQRVVIISENAARRWFPGGALGSDLILRNNNEDRILRVVGIAGNTKYWNLRDPIPATMFVPYTQWNQAGTLALRTSASKQLTYTAFRQMLRQVAPGTPIRTVKTMEQQIDESLATERLTAYLSLFFAGLALLLTAVGLYGVTAYSVSRRTSEIGVRMALGAQRRSVIWLVIRETAGYAAAGAVAGVAVVAAFSRLITGLLYQVKPGDPGVILFPLAILMLVCATAAWIPARRASRLDPVAALREE